MLGELTQFEVKILAQRLRPHGDCDNLPKAPRGAVDAIVGKPREILNEDREPMDIEAEEDEIHGEDGGPDHC